MPSLFHSSRYSKFLYFRRRSCWRRRAGRAGGEAVRRPGSWRSAGATLQVPISGPQGRLPPRRPGARRPLGQYRQGHVSGESQGEGPWENKVCGVL